MSDQRHLTEGEKAMVRSVFGQFPEFIAHLDEVIISNQTQFLIPQNRPSTSREGNIYMGDDFYDRDYSELSWSNEKKNTSIHEMTHVFQARYQNRDIAGEAIGTAIVRWFDYSSAYRYTDNKNVWEDLTNPLIFGDRYLGYAVATTYKGWVLT